MDKRTLNRVTAGRLWDDSGREWTCARTEWADRAAVAQVLQQTPARVALHGLGRPLEWLDIAAARSLWARIEARHFELPGSHAAVADDDGLTYAAHVWRSGNDLLLGFESFC